jgi:hypothetical protein
MNMKDSMQDNAGILRRERPGIQDVTYDYANRNEHSLRFASALAIEGAH